MSKLSTIIVKGILPVAIIIVVFCSGCVKQKIDNDTIGISNILKLEREDVEIANLITNILYRMKLDFKDSTLLIGNTPIITYPDSSYALFKMTIDFGNIGSFNNIWDSGKIRTGKISVIWRGNLFDNGTLMQVSTLNYTVNKVPMCINEFITTMDSLHNGYQTYNIKSNDSALFNNNWTTFNLSSKRMWLNNFNYNPFDDKVGITGNAYGIDGRGNAYHYYITDTLWIHEACLTKKLYSGHMICDVQGKQNRTVNIGSTCGSQIKITIDQNNFYISL